MEAKKNEKVQIEKESNLYFVLALCLVLALTYVALEWKTFHEIPVWEVAELDKPDFLPNEEIPFIKPPEPPKPKVAPLIIEILPDISDEPESIIDIPEVDQTTEINPLESVVFEEPPVDEEIIFVNVEEKPIFPGCEDATDKYSCFQEMMQKHIRKNFNYPETAIDLGIKGKVHIKFTIQKDGSIGNIQMRGPHKLLEDEASRIIKELPKMKPGKQRGTPVKVPFSIPINFVLQ